MRTQSICLALAIVLLCPCSSAQWVSLPQSPRGTCLAVSGSNILVGRPGSRGFPAALYASTDNGASWDTTNSIPVHALAVSSTKVFGGGDGGVFLSTDNGLSWLAAGPMGHPVTSIAVSDTEVFAGTTNGGIFLSPDSGQSWIALSPEWTSTTVWTFALSGPNLFAGTTGGVVLSTDNGTSWSAVNSGLPTLDVRALITIGSTIFAGVYQKGVFLSTNNGTSWSRANIGLSEHCGGKAFAFYGAYLFAGTDCGVFLSSNGGATWAKANSGLTDTLVLALAVSGANLLALTYGGVWTRRLPEMTSASTTANVFPSSFSLDQNFPNPFNPSTTIGYGLPERSQVTLTVFNTLGQSVSTLVNGDLEAGYHEVTFDGKNLSSGLYFYRIQAGSFVETRRLLLIR